MRHLDWPGYLFKDLQSERHPYHYLLRTFTAFPPDDYTFGEHAKPYVEYDNHKLLMTLDIPGAWGEFERFRMHLLEWRTNCRNLGVPDDVFMRLLAAQNDHPDFIHRLSRSFTVPEGVPCVISPYPIVVPNDWLLEIEDWCTLFYWFFHNGDTAKLDIKNHIATKVLKALLMMDNFKGIFSHIKQTVESLRAIFGPELHNKFFYCPLGYTQPDLSQKKKSDGKVRFLFHGSSGHTPIHFSLRGGFYFLDAFRRVEAMYPNIEFTVVYAEEGAKHLHPVYFDYLKNHPKIRYIGRFVSDEEMRAELLQSDVLVIPAYRTHSMTVAQGLSYGMPVLCSNGWGFSEYIMDGYNGLVANFTPGLNSWVDSQGIFREQYEPVNTLDETIVRNLASKISLVMENPALLQMMQRNALDFAQNNLSIKVRNTHLKHLFDYAFRNSPTPSF